MRRLPLLLLAFSWTTFAFGQADITGDHQYPQFRSLSGLPGGTSGLLINGAPDFKGAMGISTPVAFSMATGHYVFGLGNTSYKRRLDFFGGNGTSHEDNGNGTAYGMTGLSTPIGNFTISGMVLSRIGDSVMNLHFSPKLQGTNNKVGIGIGLQDVFSTGGTSGEKLDLTNGGGNSRSFYGVVTGEVYKDSYLSVGTGTNRFKGIFANASAPIIPHIKGIVEYDAFNFNYGLSGDLGKFRLGFFANRDIDVQTTAFLGMIRGKYLTWAVAFSF